jgi:signal transduction histidine kinase
MHGQVRDYAIGIGAALLALALRAALEPWLHGSLPFLLAFGGVTLAVWRAGAGPAIVAALIGYAGSNLVVRGEVIPEGIYGRGWGISIMAYALSSGAIIAFGVVIRAAHARLLAENEFRRRAEDEAIRSRQALALEDRRKSEFLATLAHELRNPLAPLRSALQVLRGPRAEAAARAQALAVMDRQLRHMVRLIDDLLDVSRISRDQVRLQRAPLDLAGVVRAALETAGPVIAAKHHRVELAWPDQAAWVDGDATRLTQILSNLLDNAAKYTPAGGRIAVALRAAGEAAEIVVEDDGVGIPPDKLPRVFDMFARVETEGAAPQAGLGIGLALARRLAELHAGTLVAQSAGPGRGSGFVLRLPRIAAPAAAATPAAAPTSTGALQRRILVVDDNVDAATAMAAMLELDGHRVEAAFDGASALDAADRFEPEVALLDIGMPGMDGHELARRLALRPWARALVLVAVTGWGQETDRRRSQDAGFAHHLVKPVDPADLAALLAALR